MSKSYNQLNTTVDGTIYSGAHIDGLVQAQVERDTVQANLDAIAFQTIVDSGNVNHRYSSVIQSAEGYFASRGLQIDPIHIVSRNTYERACRTRVGKLSDTITSAEGTYLHNRAVVVENATAQGDIGEDFILGIALHEAAHSLGKTATIHTVTDRLPRINILSSYAVSGLMKADLRRKRHGKIVGGFWEEGFADLTRVRAMKLLGRSPRMTGKPKLVEGLSATYMVGTTDAETTYSNNPFATLVLPAEFAIVAKTMPNGRNLVGVSQSNFAAYAIDILDKKSPGLYDDLEAGTSDPKRQADAIQKIEGIRPGLYRQLGQFTDTQQDFVHGLKIALQI